MSYATKRSIALTGLVAVCLWPPVHHALVTRLDLNPWKWFGWSMYTTPPPVINTYALDGDDGRELPIGQLTPPQRRRLLRAYNAFGDLRKEIGRWIEPDDFAAALFDMFPKRNHLRLVVQVVSLDRRTARFDEQRRDTYDYDRPAAADQRPSSAAGGTGG